MEDTRAINHDCDICYSPDEGGYYLQQYKLDGKGTTRTSGLYKMEGKAIKDYELCLVKWGEWS